MLKVFITLIKDKPENDEWESRTLVVSGKLKHAYQPFGVKLEVEAENLFKEPVVLKTKKKYPPKVSYLIPNRNYLVEVQDMETLKKEFSYGKLKGFCIEKANKQGMAEAYFFFDLL